MKKFIVMLLGAFSVSVQAAPSAPFGVLRGMTQFMFTPYQSPNEQAVATFILNMGADFKVTGGSQELGCKALGIASPGLAKHILNLDLTLSDCRNPHYNQRLHGYVAGRDDGAVTLSLQWVSVTLPLKGNFTLSGTLQH